MQKKKMIRTHKSWEYFSENLNIRMRKSNPKTLGAYRGLIGKDHITKEKKKIIISPEKAKPCYNTVFLCVLGDKGQNMNRMNSAFLQKKI